MISIIDIFLVICLGLAIWKGWMNGFVYEIVMFLALFAALYIAIHFSQWGAHLIGGDGEDSWKNTAQASFIATFILILVAFWLLAKVLSGLANNGSGEVMNRMGGAVFALAKSLIVLSLLLILVTGSDAKFKLLSKEQREKSVLLKPVYDYGVIIMPAVKNSDFYKKITDSTTVNETAKELKGDN